MKIPTHTLDPHARLFNDPRRPGRAMLAVWCWCGRFYTATPENLIRNSHNMTAPCPSCAEAQTLRTGLGSRLVAAS